MDSACHTFHPVYFSEKQVNADDPDGIRKTKTGSSFHKHKVFIRKKTYSGMQKFEHLTWSILTKTSLGRILAGFLSSGPGGLVCNILCRFPSSNSTFTPGYWLVNLYLSIYNGCFKSLHI